MARVRREISMKRNPKRQSITLPNQAITPAMIMEKFLKGMPVSVSQRDPVYVDQDLVDYEQLNRMDFDERLEYAAQLRERTAQLKEQADKQLKEDADRKEKDDEAAFDAALARAAAKKEALKKPTKKTNIDPA